MKVVFVTEQRVVWKGTGKMMKALAVAEELIQLRASIIAPQSPLIAALDFSHFRKVKSCH